MLLAQCNNDRHPDAHACRLHVSLHAMHTPLAAHLQQVWDVRKEMRAYVHKRWHVALSCRLEVAQELLLLTHISAEAVADDANADAVVGGVLRNRRMLLEAATQMDISEPPPASTSPGGGLLGGIGNAIAGAITAITGPSSAANSIQLPCPAPAAGPQFDGVLDRSCVDEGVLADLGQLFGKLSTIKYERPESLVGLPAVVALDK